jgi:hypothetical protein
MSEESALSRRGVLATPPAIALGGTRRSHRYRDLSPLLPGGVRSRVITASTGSTHILEAEETPNRPAVLMRMVSELAYSWRNVMPTARKRVITRHRAGPARLRAHDRLGRFYDGDPDQFVY